MRAATRTVPTLWTWRPVGTVTFQLCFATGDNDWILCRRLCYCWCITDADELMRLPHCYQIDLVDLPTCRAPTRLPSHNAVLSNLSNAALAMTNMQLTNIRCHRGVTWTPSASYAAACGLRRCHAVPHSQLAPQQAQRQAFGAVHRAQRSARQLAQPVAAQQSSAGSLVSSRVVEATRCHASPS